MTTIAIRDGILAIDSKVTSGSICVGEAQKYAIADGLVVAGCGNIQSVKKYMAFAIKGKLGDVGILERFSGYYIEGGKVYVVDDNCIPYEMEAAFYADGSGCDIAMGAMAHGATAAEAVEIAAKYDGATGGKIVQIDLQKCQVLNPSAS